MRYNLQGFYQYLLVVIICCLQFNSFSQELASINKIEPKEGIDQNYKPNALQKFLKVKDITVSGKVTSEEDGSGLPGVNVVVMGTTVGTTVGTVTDIEGNYNLNVADENATLVFSFIGFTTQEVPINNRAVIDVTLATDVTSLDEVVVVGYGTQEKREITSAVASVQAEDFNAGNVNNPSQLIQGKVAGLIIAKPGGDPLGGFNIRLRGTASATGSTEPLIIIDGVPGADLSNIDPNDIASMDVLKDGSAAAIYGTRATNGVILVTTKSGQAGEPVISYNGYVSTEQVANRTDVLTPSEYRGLVTDPEFAYANENLDLGSSTDWFETITRTPISHVHNVSLSGGSQNTTYRVSLNYRDIQGLALNSGFDQLNGRLNLTQKALDGRLTLSMILGNTTRNFQETDDNAFRMATIYNPTAPVYDARFPEYGGYYQSPGSFNYENPLAIVEQITNEGIEKSSTANFRADYELFEGLTAGAFYSIQRDTEQRGFYAPKDAYTIGFNSNGRASRNMDEESNQLFEATLNFDRDFGNSNVKALAGYSYQYLTNEGFGISAGNFLTDFFTYNNLGASEDIAQGINPQFGSFKESSKLVAFFGRVNYSFEDTYYLSAIVRREGSSKFGAANKWAWFPAISGGININNLVDIPFVDLLKFRVGYGVTGSLPEDNYVSLERLRPGGFFLYNGSYIQTYSPGSNPNPFLQWETKGEINVGLDFTMFDFRLSGSIDVYNRNTTDLLYPVPVPTPPYLFNTLLTNLGELNNKGIEVAMNGTPLQKDDFSWDAAFNFAFNRTKIVSLSSEEFDFGDQQFRSNLGSPGLNATQLVRLKEGEPLGQIWGPVYGGIGEDGEWILEDTNDDGTFNNADEQVIGNGLPDFTFGINNTFRYKNIDLNFFFRGTLGHDLVNTYRAFYEVPKVISSYNILASALEGDISRLREDARFSSFHVEDASFLRLDNATIGYNFDVGNINHLSNFRLYLSAQNLFNITNYSGIDPEVRFDDNGDQLAPGIERRNTYFLNRSFTLGVNVSF